MAKTKAKKRERSRRPRQPKLPGMEGVSIAVIDAAAAVYVDARDNRIAYLRDELKAGDDLLSVMRDNKLEHYEYDGQVVDVVAKTKVKVKRTKNDDEEGESVEVE